MIALLAGLGCGADKGERDPGEPAAEEIFLPAEGTWELAWAEQYEGDCALEDMATRQPPLAEWELELEANGFTFYDESGYPVGCDLAEDRSFLCSQGEYTADYSQSGVYAVETVGTDIRGVFTDPESAEGSLEISAACAGDDCDVLAEANGPEFAYPCTAIAPFTAAWTGE